MKKYLLGSFAAIAIALTVVACDDNPSGPSPTDVATLTATLLPANEVPPITNAEAGGSATATLKLNLTKDNANAITSASLDLTVTTTGFPANTTLTDAHIHSGAVGVNGGVFVSAGLSAGEVKFPDGGGTFTKTGISVTSAQAEAILANPANFYFNIHTTLNSGGVARGQLARVQ